MHNFSLPLKIFLGSYVLIQKDKKECQNNFCLGLELSEEDLQRQISNFFVLNTTQDKKISQSAKKKKSRNKKVSLTAHHHNPLNTNKRHLKQNRAVDITSQPFTDIDCKSSKEILPHILSIVLGHKDYETNTYIENKCP